MLSTTSLMLRSAACPEEPSQAASRRGRVSKHATTPMQRLLALRGEFFTRSFPTEQVRGLKAHGKTQEETRG